MKKRVLVLLGHPSNDSLCASLAQSYIEGAQKAGHEVRYTAVGQLQFDPLLHNGYETIQSLEPDLVQFQQDMAWAQHVVWVYPIWWGTMPALLKGLIDRTFLPGFAFKFHPGQWMAEQLLTGRSAHLMVTMDTPPWYDRWVYRQPGQQQMKRLILEFCGIQPVAVTRFGPVKDSTTQQRARWLARAHALGAKV